MRGEHSRRSFLIRVAGALALPVALGSACRRKSKTTIGHQSGTLDEVENAASFRPPIPTSEPFIRVRVLRVRDAEAAAAGLRIGSEGQWLNVGGGESHGKGVALSGPVHVALDSRGWSVVDAKGFRPAVSHEAPIVISIMDDAGNELMTVTEPGTDASKDARAYPGALHLVARRDVRESSVSPSDENALPSSFDVVNHVPIELYLPGVLAGELYKSWHLETHAAQAVAARSFACTEAAVFAGKRHYDVTNTASSQMYVGGGTHTRSQDAVAMTRGLMLSYEGLLVSGYYSSCCGGAAACAVDAIGSNPVNNVAPLRGRSGSDVCHEASVYKWTVQQSVDVLTRRLNAYGQERRRQGLIDLTRLASVDVIAANANGRPTRVRVMDETEAAVEMSAEDFRRAANHSGQGLHPPAKPLRSSHLRASFSRTTVTFDGFGFGHGVGLCQYGAEALARNGSPHQDIVRWYYPDVELVKAYG